MNFSCKDQKCSEFNCGHFGIKIKPLRPSCQKLYFSKQGNGRGQKRVWSSKTKLKHSVKSCLRMLSSDTRWEIHFGNNCHNLQFKYHVAPYLLKQQPVPRAAVWGGGHRYFWILLDTDFFGYLANFWDPSIQVSKKKHVFTPNFLTLGTRRGRGLGLNSLLL